MSEVYCSRGWNVDNLSSCTASCYVLGVIVRAMHLVSVSRRHASSTKRASSLLPSVSPGRTLNKSPITTVLATDDHAESLATFYREAWSAKDAGGEKVLAARCLAARRNIAFPGTSPPTAIALEGGRVVAHCTTVPDRFLLFGEERPGYWTKGLMVLPEHRNGPLGFAVLRTLVSQLPNSAAMVVSRPARRLFSALGFHDLGPIPNFIRPIRPANVLARLSLDGLGLEGLPKWVRAAARIASTPGIRPFVSLALKVWLRTSLRLATGMRPAANRTLTYGLPMPEDMDSLWAKAKEEVQAAPVKDSRYFRARYEGPAGSSYTVVAGYDPHGLSGLATVRWPSEQGDPRLNGIRIATLSDGITAPIGRAGLVALLTAAISAADAAGADALLATCGHSRMTQALVACGFRRLPGNVHFLVRFAGVNPIDYPPQSEWWLGRGDGDADGVF